MNTQKGWKMRYQWTWQSWSVSILQQTTKMKGDFATKIWCRRCSSFRMTPNRGGAADIGSQCLRAIVWHDMTKRLFDHEEMHPLMRSSFLQMKRQRMTSSPQLPHSKCSATKDPDTSKQTTSCHSLRGCLIFRLHSAHAQNQMVQWLWQQNQKPKPARKPLWTL